MEAVLFAMDIACIVLLGAFMYADRAAPRESGRDGAGGRVS